MKFSNQALSREVRSLQKTVARLDKKHLGDEKREKSKEQVALSADLSELHKKDDGLQVSADDALARTATLAAVRGRSSEWLDIQAQTNRELANHLDHLEAPRIANPHAPDVNHVPQVHHNLPPVAPETPQTPPALRNPHGKAW